MFTLFVAFPLQACTHVTPHISTSLQIKTVVDLRGRAERGKRSKSSEGRGKGKDSVGPPPLLNPEQVSALGAAQGRRSMQPRGLRRATQTSYISDCHMSKHPCKPVSGSICSVRAETGHLAAMCSLL